MSTQVEEVALTGPNPCQVVSSALESNGEKSSELGPPYRALDNGVKNVKQCAENPADSDGEKEPSDARSEEENWIDLQTLPTDPHERRSAMLAIMKRAEQEAIDAGLWLDEGDAPDRQEPVWRDTASAEGASVESSVQLDGQDFDIPEESNEGERLVEQAIDAHDNLSPPEINNLLDSMQSSNEDRTVAKGKGKKKRGCLDLTAKTMVCGLIKHGFNRDQAARFVGVHPSAITKAAHRCKDFDQKLRAAETLREFDSLGNIIRAGSRSWRASAWLLERMEPKHYGRTLGRDRVVLRLALSQFADTVCRKLQLDEKTRKQMEGWIEKVAERCR